MSEVTFLTQDLWSTLRAESARSGVVVAAVAYVTNIDDIRFQAGDILILDASEEAIRAGKTSALILEELLNRGIFLYSSPNLHAKVYVFDEALIAGSSNLSSSSRNTLVECAVLTRDPAVIAEARDWIQSVASRSVRVDHDFVSRAKATVVERSEPERQHQPATGGLWYLSESPNALSKNMRAYFVALVIAQLGAFEAGRPFRLWPNADFRQHEREGRLRRDGIKFVLTQLGVDYFSHSNQWPREDLLQVFLIAVRTGNSGTLPEGIETRMLPFPGM